MTHNDIYTKFMIEYDKANVTSSYPSLTKYEVATILDKAYLALIARKLTGNNTRRVPFEYDTKAIEDLRPLITSKIVSSSTAITEASNELAFKLPDDLLYYLEGQASYTNADSNAADNKAHFNEIVNLVDHRTALRFRATNTNMPWIKQPVSFLQGNDVYVLYDTYKHSDPLTLLVTYLEKPASFVDSLTTTEDTSGGNESGTQPGDNTGDNEPTYNPGGDEPGGLTGGDEPSTPTQPSEDIPDNYIIDTGDVVYDETNKWYQIAVYAKNHKAWPYKWYKASLNSNDWLEYREGTLTTNSTYAIGYHNGSYGWISSGHIFRLDGDPYKLKFIVYSNDMSQVLYTSKEFIIQSNSSTSEWEVYDVYKSGFDRFLVTGEYYGFNVTWKNKNTGETCKSNTTISGLSNVINNDNDQIKIQDQLDHDMTLTIESVCKEDSNAVYRLEILVFPRELFYRTINVKVISADGYPEKYKNFHNGFDDNGSFISCDVKRYHMEKKTNGEWELKLNATLFPSDILVVNSAYAEYAKDIIFPGITRIDGATDGEYDLNTYDYINRRYNVIGWADGVSENTNYSSMSRTFPGLSTNGISEFNIVVKKIL